MCNGENCLKQSHTNNEIVKREQLGMKETSSKNDECMNLVRSIINQDGDKILVFSDYVTPLKDLEVRLHKEGKLQRAKGPANAYYYWPVEDDV